MTEIRRLERELRGNTRGRAVLVTALKWWIARRPLTWSQAEHFDNPTINAHASPPERERARAIGALALELERRAARRPPLRAKAGRNLRRPGNLQ